MIRIGQLGIGYWGKNLLRNFYELPECRVTTVYDPKPSAVQRAKQIAPDVLPVCSDQELIDSPDVDAVVIVAPAMFHADLSIRALKAGKHVFVEKPMATSLDDAQKMVEAVHAAGKILMVGHLLEHHPAFTSALDTIRSGEIGTLCYMNSVRLNLGRIRSDESAMWSLAPHDVSVALMLAGRNVVSVSATGCSCVQENIEDVAFFSMRFDGGLLAHCHTSWLDADKRRQLTVVGRDKIMVIDDMEPEEKVRIHDKGVDYQEWNGEKVDTVPVRSGAVRSVNYEKTEPLRIECQAFLDAVETGNAPRTDEMDGLRVVSVLDAVERSMKAGGAPIDLPPL